MIAYLSIFIKGKTVKVIAFDSRHKELWQRNDPDAVYCWKLMKRNGVPTFEHYE